MKKIHHQLFNNQSIELSSSSEVDNVIQEGEVIFKKNSTLGLPEISKLIDSAISKRQVDMSNTKFLNHVTLISSVFFVFFLKKKTFTSGRYHRDMKTLEILASNSKHFRIYGIFLKWQIGVSRLTC